LGVAAAIHAAGRLVQPDLAFSLFGPDPFASKSLLATIALGLAAAQVLLALWMYRKLPLAPPPAAAGADRAPRYRIRPVRGHRAHRRALPDRLGRAADQPAGGDPLGRRVLLLRAFAAKVLLVYSHRLPGWALPAAGATLALLIILGCILAPRRAGVRTGNQVSDTSWYVANVTPLIHDPAIQNALTNKITNEIATRIDVKGLTDQAAANLSQKGFTRIGSLLQGLPGPLASGVQGFVHSRIHKIITGPRMANAWVQVNRAASQQLNAVLSGRGGKNGALGVSNGQVTLDLAPLIARRQARPRRARADDRRQDPHRARDVRAVPV
jgi:Family of unknown function (DUF6529)